MRSVASLVLLVTLVACETSPELKNQRVEFWQHKVAQELQVGTPKSEIQAWAANNHLQFTERYSKGEARPVIFVEDVPGSFSPLTGCKGWLIYIHFVLDASDRMTSDLVRADPICL
jgi:hypothetical protein